MLVKLKKEMKKQGISAVIFFNKDPNIRYLTNFEEFACLIIQKQAVLFVPEMNYTRAKKESKVKVRKWPKDLTKELKKIKSKTIGINKNRLTLNQYKKIRATLKNKKIKDISKIAAEVRTIKTQQEIKYLKTACRLTDKIFQNTITQIKKGKLKTETDVSSYLVYQTLKQGHELSFDPVVASGKNSRYPHHKPKNTNIHNFCIIDFGVKYKGYHADMTRTIYIGNPTKKEKALYEKVLNTQQNLIKMSSINSNCANLFKAAEKMLNQKLIHGLGHGVGTEIHELPSLTTKSKEKLKENMVFTIEPGIYNKQGIRIEDTILLTKKPIILTKTTKKLICIK